VLLNITHYKYKNTNVSPKMRENLERESEGVSGSLEGNQNAPVGRGGVLGTKVSSESVPVTRKRRDFFQHLDKITTPFFFTHFPDSLNNSDLRKLFSRFGNVAEVFIPRKRDKRGSRFDFVKFKEVKDEVDLGRRLEEVWWGDSKLKVNRARFSREEKKMSEVPDAGGGEIGNGVGGR
jgi:RNA recognition motif-containing protein